VTPRSLRGGRPFALCLSAAATLLIWAPQAHAAHPPPGHGATDSAIEDPLEPINRFFYKINRVIDHALLRPLALGYQKVMPKPLQKAVHNVVTELGEPLVFTNDLLQLKPKRAAGTAARFVTNATLGVAGTFDPAKKFGLPHRDNGFGVTLARYGIKPGPYVFLPLLGPANFRELIGLGVDTYADPVRLANYPYSNTVTIGVFVLGGLDERARAEEDLTQVEEMGTDPYATLRSLYLQNREAEIRGEQPLKIEELPDFADPAAEASPAAVPNAPAATEAAPEASDGPPADIPAEAVAPASAPAPPETPQPAADAPQPAPAAP
jgi:phospholipid-binding lipoprotein MlaA